MVDDIKYLLKFGSKENMESLLYKGEIYEEHKVKKFQLVTE